MKVLLITYDGNEIQPEGLAEISRIIGRYMKEGDVRLNAQLISDTEYAKLMLQGIPLEQPVDATLDMVHSAIQFCIDAYGSPLDNEDSFRAHFNRGFYKPITLGENQRMRQAVKAFAYANSKKTTSAVRRLLKENGFQNMPQYCKELLIFSDTE